MSAARRKAWTRRVLASLVVLAVLAFTLHAVEFSDAGYAAGSVNPADLFVAGTLLHTNSKNGQVIIAASGLEPGDSSVGTMTLTGTGTVSGSFTLSISSLVDVPSSPALSDTLQLTVEDITGAPATLYDDDVGDLPDTPLGTIAPGASRTYRITLSYPDGADDATLQGATMNLTLQVTGETT